MGELVIKKVILKDAAAWIAEKVAGWSKNSGDFGQRLRHRLCNATPSEGGGLHRGGCVGARHGQGPRHVPENA